MCGCGGRETPGLVCVLRGKLGRGFPLLNLFACAGIIEFYPIQCTDALSNLLLDRYGVADASKISFRIPVMLVSATVVLFFQGRVARIRRSFTYTGAPLLVDS